MELILEFLKSPKITINNLESKDNHKQYGLRKT
jgi:hypothetical protein